MSRIIKMLIAEDDEEFQILIKKACEKSKWDYYIEFARDGDEFLSIASNARLCDLFVMDLNMPKMGGFECIKSLKEKILDKNTPIVVLTSSKLEVDMQKGFSLGISSFITKPDSFSEFVHIMDDIGEMVE